MANIQRISFVLVAAVAATACIPRHPTRTTRPDIDISPWTERTVRSEATGQQYHYMHLPGPEGAPTVLLVHGAFMDNRIWLNADNLSNHFEVIAPMMPNEAPYYEGDLSDMGQALADFLDALGVDQLVIAGISAGAYWSIDLIVNHPELEVQGLLLLSTEMMASSEDEVEGRLDLAERALDMDPDRLRALIEYIVERRGFDPAQGPVQQQNIFWVRPYSYYRQLFSALQSQGDQPQTTETIEIPVLIIHGSEDELIEVEEARQSTDAFPNATFHLFEGMGHDLIFTNGDEVTAHMVDFVDDHDLYPDPRPQEPAAEPEEPAAEPEDPAAETGHMP